jgi:putative methyltransferase (TIGR04325 family)
MWTTMKALIRALLSASPARRALAAVSRTSPGFALLNWLSRPRGVFAEFEDAVEYCRRKGLRDHEDPALTDLHSWVASRIRPSDYSALFWLNAVPGATLRVFDFGGSIGGLYHLYSRYLEPLRQLEWTTYDLPAVVERGRKKAGPVNSTWLRFTSDLGDAEGTDVFFSSGSLHYVQESIPALFSRMPKLLSHVIINRTPLRVQGPSFISIQASDGFGLPLLVRNRDQVEAEFASLGYQVVDRWRTPEKEMSFPLLPNHSVYAYSGMYLRRGASSIVPALF